MPSARLQPLAPRRYGLQVTLDESTYEKLREAQDLLAHSGTGRDVARTLDRALELLVNQLKRRRFGLTDTPRLARRAKSARCIPARVRQQVWQRDEGRCTFVSDSGQRCPARGSLEFDHVLPVARGGDSTLANLRLRCRAHNQYEAERTYGAGFMEGKREAARERREREASATAPS
jgi:5-methylcytosine-specific restriction endonuclease McrA